MKLFGEQNLSRNTSFHLPFRRDIQILRGIVVLAVVLFHVNANYFPFGYLGVDVFFVISGFVVTPLILELFDNPLHKRESWITRINHFYVKRFYRLAPALIVTLVISTTLLFFLAPVEDHQRISRQGLATLFLLGNLGAYLYAGNYFQPGPNPLIHTWSLSIEAQIYLLLPILFVLVLGRQRNVRQIFILSLTILSGLSFLLFALPVLSQNLYSLIGIAQPELFSFYSLLERVWQFTLGGLLFFNNQKIFLNRALRNLVSIIAILLLILCLFSPFGVNLKMSSVLATFVALFVLFFRSLDILPNILKVVLQWFGDRSYSIYLIHLPFIYLIKYAPLFESSSRSVKILQALGAVLLTFLVGNVMYSLIENPFRTFYRYTEQQKLNFWSTTVLMLFIPLVLLAGWNEVSSWKVFIDPNSPIRSKIVPWGWDSNCVFFHGEHNPNSRPCFYPAVNRKGSYLLIGDSHAASVSKTFINLAKNQNMDLYIYTYSGCPFVLNKAGLLTNVTYPFFSEDCFKHNHQILKFLNTVKIDKVIYTQRSSVLYLSSLSDISRKNLNSKIKSDLLKLTKLTPNVIFLGITPEYKPTSTVLDVFLSRKGHYLPTPALDNNYWRNSLIFTKIRYLDIYSLFCRGFVDCRNRAGGAWLFHDNDHLSEKGGEFIMPVVEKTISLHKKG